MASSSRRLRPVSPALLVAALLAGFATVPAHALKTDRQQALDVTSDQFHADQQKNITVLTGNVRLTQGTIKGDGDKATVYQDADNQIKRVVLVGKPAHMQQQQDNDGGLMTAQAQTIDYHADTDLVDLAGDVIVVQQGRGEFHGAHMIYNTETGEMQSGDLTPGSRVHLRMLPKVKNPASARPAATPVPAKHD